MTPVAAQVAVGDFLWWLLVDGDGNSYAVGGKNDNCGVVVVLTSSLYSWCRRDGDGYAIGDGNGSCGVMVVIETMSLYSWCRRDCGCDRCFFSRLVIFVGGCGVVVGVDVNVDVDVGAHSKIHRIRLNFDREIVRYNKNTNHQHELVMVKCWKLRIKADKYRALVRTASPHHVIDRPNYKRELSSIHSIRKLLIMAGGSSSSYVLILCSFLFVSSAIAQTSFRPNALTLPVTKDPSTLQYLTEINQRTPLVPVSVTLDLGGQFLWVDCDQGYVSSTYRPARCRSAQCSLARATGCGECFSPPRPGCNNNTCGLLPDNTVTRTATSGELASDVVSIQSTDGRNPGRNVSVSQFLFVCGSTFLLQGLASGVKGMAGLGRTRIALPSQFAADFSFDRKFAVCLSSSTTARGVVIFGDGPYRFLPNIDASTNLIYTPLIINPVSTASAYSSGEPSAEYFIGVKIQKLWSQLPFPAPLTLREVEIIENT
ncbi:uncharacterized protein LOC111382292 [Olea europaea var. sylvestris]|uniref:uncharacterized protein LOC111382292 n=1 Tax=Olea europaea var. sylvestris TaxID=158386 RepID=UPI000C1D4B55|nr:uncharacterized protein LOC111382292 [Olea europaea var. sylvestris]